MAVGNWPFHFSALTRSTSMRRSSSTSRFCASEDPGCASGMSWDVSAGDGLAGSCALSDNVSCGGQSVDQKSDPGNCGACGHICPTQSNTTGSTCNAGTCGFLGCNAGFASCNSASIQDGCETSITTTSNCGGCGVTCSGKPNATAYVCANQLCAVTNCSPNFGDCDGQYSTGCESNLTNDVQNCGTCGHVCNLDHANNACVGGSCAIGSCQAGYGNCNNRANDGCEANLTVDRNNCGSCGTICASNKICDSGHCVFPF